MGTIDMPLYEYKCGKCNEVFEVLQRFSDAPLKVHDGCGGRVQRLMTAPSFQFKGSGWYATDYAKKGGPNGGSNGNKSESDGKPPAETGKEAAKETASKTKESSSSSSTSNTSTPPAAPPK
ncbi:MAG: FmdB family zinc ribbon protein [Bryobacteraceae bacterium]